MAESIDIRAILVRAETRAHQRLAALRSIKADSISSMTDYENRIAELEEAFASACAVRRNWEECERRATAPNRSALESSLYEEPF